MVQCELCGKEFKNTQGLRGHKTFVHGITSSNKQPVAGVATEQELSKLECRLEQVEELTQLDIERLTEQLEQRTHQLTELSEQLKNLSQQVKLASSNTEFRNISRQVTQLSEQVKRHDSWLTPDPIVLLFGNDSYARPAFLLDIDRLGARVNDHQGAINWVRKKFNLVKNGNKA